MNTATPICSKRFCFERLQLLRFDTQLGRELLERQILREPGAAQDLPQTSAAAAAWPARARCARYRPSRLCCSSSCASSVEPRKPLRSCAAQRSAAAALSSSRSTLKHIQSTGAVAGRACEIALHERARLEVVTALIRQLHHVRAAHRRSAGLRVERRAEVLVRLLELAGVARANAGVRQRRPRVSCSRSVVGRAAEIRLGVGPAILPVAEKHGVRVRRGAVVRIELRRAADSESRLPRACRSDRRRPRSSSALSTRRGSCANARRSRSIASSVLPCRK